MNHAIEKKKKRKHHDILTVTIPAHPEMMGLGVLRNVIDMNVINSNMSNILF